MTEFAFLVPKVAAGQPHNFGTNYSKWMLLERVRFTLDGLECNKIGVSYEAYRGQPNFCSSPLWSCLHNQLWHFWEVSILKSFFDLYLDVSPTLSCLSSGFWMISLINKLRYMHVVFLPAFPWSSLLELFWSLIVKFINQIKNRPFKLFYSLKRYDFSLY